MIDGNDHSEQVDAWLRAAPRLCAEQLLQRFEQVLSALIRRAHQTLGEVTLTAVLDRVVCLAAEKFPIAAAMKVESNGVSCRELLEPGGTRPREEVVESIRFIMTAFLTLLGNLTAEVLTPALHSELLATPEDGDLPQLAAAVVVPPTKRQRP